MAELSGLATRIRQFPFFPGEVCVSVSPKGIAFLAYMESWVSRYNEEEDYHEDVPLESLPFRAGSTLRTGNPSLATWCEENIVHVGEDYVMFLPRAVGLLTFNPDEGRFPFCRQYYVMPTELRPQLEALWKAGCPVLIAGCGRGSGGWSTTRNLIIPPCWGDLGHDLKLFQYFLGTKEEPTFGPYKMDEHLPVAMRIPFNYAQMKARMSQVVALNDDVDASDFLIELTPECLAGIMELAPKIPTKQGLTPWEIWAPSIKKRLAGRWGWPCGEWAERHPEMGKGLDPLSALCVKGIEAGNNPNSPFDFLTEGLYGWRASDRYSVVLGRTGAWCVGQCPLDLRPRRGGLTTTWSIAARFTFEVSLSELHRYAHQYAGTTTGRRRLAALDLSREEYYVPRPPECWVSPGRTTLRAALTDPIRRALPPDPPSKLKCLKLAEDGRRWSQHLQELTTPKESAPCSGT